MHVDITHIIRTVVHSTHDHITVTAAIIQTAMLQYRQSFSVIRPKHILHRHCWQKKVTRRGHEITWMNRVHLLTQAQCGLSLLSSLSHSARSMEICSQNFSRSLQALLQAPFVITQDYGERERKSVSNSRTPLIRAARTPEYSDTQRQKNHTHMCLTIMGQDVKKKNMKA